MKLILLSGGSGKRLWPLSNDARSKQFLKVLKAEDGRKVSMVQRVWSQLRSVGLAEDTLIATSKSQVDLIESQLGLDVRVIVEPERRDTFPAIALAASYLSSAGTRPDEVVAVLPVDPYAEVKFFDKIKELAEAFAGSETEMGLIGVVPSYPSEKYGYIVLEDGSENEKLHKVARFKEKPCREEAEELIRQGGLWNCGVFVFRLEFLLGKVRALAHSNRYEELLERYDQLPKISFDYEVVEKAKNVSVLRFDGAWKDLGTWNTLTDEMPEAVSGNGRVSEDSLNTHVINELEVPVAVLGCHDLVVAASPDGVLVCKKAESHRVKDIVGDFMARPMYEERRWGSYQVLDHTKYENGREVLTKKLTLKAGKSLSYQYHLERSEVWTIARGKGEFALNGRIYPVHEGDVLHIPVEAKHGLYAVTDLDFIEVQAGSPLIEEDIVRIFMEWSKVRDACEYDLERQPEELLG